MRGFLVLAAALPLWAQTEPQFACAGNRAELLFYPEEARKSGLEGTVLADFAIDKDGIANDFRFTSTVVSIYGDTVFGPVVRMYLEQSTFPPGCDKARKLLRFEFVLRGQAGKERRSQVQFKLPGTLEVSANPMRPRTETSVPVSPGECLGSRLDFLRYPQMARTTRTYGTVAATARIESDRKTKSVNIKSGPPLLRQAVKDFLEQSEFATCRGEVEFTFQFVLGDALDLPASLEFLSPNTYRITAEASRLNVDVGSLAQPVK